ncbi:MAG: hypothetical protein WBV59_04465 [Anaerolineae bacterium]
MKTRRTIAWALITLAMIGSLVLGLTGAALAWPTAPTINSDIGSDEYGTGNAYAYTSGTPTWYMTWDDTYLYVSIQNADQTEAGIAYFDLNPIAPVNGGSASNGGLTGLSAYDGLTPDLPFRADAAIYFKNNYRELRRWDGSSAWTSINAGDGGLSGTPNDYSDNSYSSNNRSNGDGNDDDRELRVSWCRLTGGSSNCRPSTFNWTGYVAYSNGVYGEVPLENPDGTFGSGATPDFIRYFTVSVTTDGSQTNPTSRNSYTHLGSDISGFGGISVYDFTMNTTGATITRGSGDWTIDGSLRVDAGTLSFGSTSSNTTIQGDVTVGVNGTFDLSTSTSNVIINGSMTNNGSVKQTKTVNASNTVFLNFNNKYFGVEIDPGASNMGSTAVTIKGNQQCSNTASNATVTRCYTITPTTTQDATTKFYFTSSELGALTLASIKMWHYNTGTSSWDQLTTASTGGSGIQEYAIATTTSYSDFTPDTNSPLAAPLASFDAMQSGDAILVTWETVSEIGNLGFNLWRGTSPNAPDVQLNSTLIPSQAPGSSQGFSYEWLDAANLVNNTTYYYWLEDVDTAGAVTRHGPISATYAAPTAVHLLDISAAPASPIVLPLVAMGLAGLSALTLRRRR